MRSQAFAFYLLRDTFINLGRAKISHTVRNRGFKCFRLGYELFHIAVFICFCTYMLKDKALNHISSMFPKQDSSIGIDINK